jgi:hypothetical protein
MDNIFTTRKKTSSTRKKTSSSHKGSTPKSIPIKVESKSPQTIQEIDLKFPDPIPEKINYDERIAQKMKKTYKSFNQVQPFLGQYIIESLFYLYLFNKYKTGCIIPANKGGWVDIELKININIPENGIKKHFQEKSVEHHEKTLFECILKGSNIVIMPIGIKFDINGEIGGHANLLIYRKNMNTIEHFEPHGDEYGGQYASIINERVNEILKKFVSKINRKINAENKKRGESGDKLYNVTLIKADIVCPRKMGVQRFEAQSAIPKAAFEPNGYCSAWSMFFTEMCLKNPEIPSREINEAILKNADLYENKNDYLRNVIKGYTNFINNKIAKYFSEIFEMPLTSAKLVEYTTEQNKDNKQEIEQIYSKLRQIIAMETGENFKRVDKYDQFRETIRPETSSSSNKNSVESPRRVSAIASEPKAITKAITKTKTKAKAITKTKAKSDLSISYSRFMSKEEKKELKALEERQRKATEEKTAKSKTKAKTVKNKSNLTLIEEEEP